MAERLRVGIAGWGNLGRGAAAAVAQQPDMKLVTIFSRRPAEMLTSLPPDVPVLGWDVLVSAGVEWVHDIEGEENHGAFGASLDVRDQIDVLLLCGGSKSDLPEHGPRLAARFTMVDSFDTHARIPEYFAAVDQASRAAGRTAVIAVGWDPGLFSLNRVLGEAVLPEGDTYMFWGDGLSQGHSDAIRRVPGVADGVQYTLPDPGAIQAVRSGARPQLTTRQKHRRECYVVLEEGADGEQVTEEIVTMPHYFADFDTKVHVISAEELARDHAEMPHGGFVMRSGTTGASGESNEQLVEYRVALRSNPEFTANVLVAYARAAHRMNISGQHGAKTVFDVPVGLVATGTAEELRAAYL